MGTHGRNAITRNGYHICHEQTMDGHDAADDFTIPFLKDGIVPKFDYPTMEDQTDECDQEYFAHIDYDKKILYTSWYNPKKIITWSDENINDEILGCLEEGPELEIDLKEIRDIYTIYCNNIEKLEKEGWSFVFNNYTCEGYACVNNRSNRKSNPEMG